MHTVCHVGFIKPTTYQTVVLFLSGDIPDCNPSPFDDKYGTSFRNIVELVDLRQWALPETLVKCIAFL